MSSIEQFLRNKESYVENCQQEHERNVQYFMSELDNIDNLISLYKANKGKAGFKKSVYAVISDIAFDDDIVKDGFKLTKHHVVQYLNIVRAERESDDE